MRMHFPCFLLAIFLASAIACSGSAQKNLQGDRFDSVRVLIEKKMKEHRIASISIAAAQDGRIVWEESFGWADTEKKIHATPHSMYALASISKSMTATGLMVLVERGLVALDKPINDYLPGAKLTTFVGDSDEATVRRVLQHAAGLPMHVNIFPAGEGLPLPPDPDESIRRYGIVVQEPGTEYHYSNFGYGVIDRVISAVSGRSYAQFMQTEVFAPLGMTHTSVMVDSSLEEFAVRHYDAQGKVVPRLDFDHRGASAVYASVHDLIRYGMFHLKNDLPNQSRIVSSETLDIMHAPSEFRVSEEETAEVRTGLGWAVIDLSGIRFLGVTGGMAGTVTRLALIPNKNVAVAVVVNSSPSGGYNPWDIEWETFAALLPDFPERPETPKPKTERPPFPPGLSGEWTGTVKTYDGVLPARLSIGNDSKVSLAIDGRTAQPIPVENPLGLVGFYDGVFKGPFFGAIPTDDARRSQSVLFLRLRLRDDTMYGYVAAVAMDRTFILPSWMALKKVTE